MATTDRIVVEVARDLHDIVKLYLADRGADLARLDLACEARNLEEVRAIGHKLHGSSGPLGFGRAGDIGAALEHAALAGDIVTVQREISALRDYFARVSIRYVQP
jgi:HPt (histidine-containing phosphotransfer) domain-containing protein